MTSDEIEFWLDRLIQGGLSEFEYCDGNARLFLRTNPQKSRVTAAATVKSGPCQTPTLDTSDEVRSPAFGVFYRQHPSAIKMDAQTGESSSSVLGYLEIDGVFSAIVSEIPSKNWRPLVEEGAQVGFGQPVFKRVRMIRFF